MLLIIVIIVLLAMIPLINPEYLGAKDCTPYVMILSTVRCICFSVWGKSNYESPAIRGKILHTRNRHLDTWSSKSRDPDPNKNSLVRKPCCRRRMESLIWICFLLTKEYIYIYIYTHIHSYTYTYIYIYIYVFIIMVRVRVPSFASEYQHYQYLFASETVMIIRNCNDY